MAISLQMLGTLEASYDGPIPPEALARIRRGSCGPLERAQAMRAHHRCHAHAALRAIRRGRDRHADLDFHFRQFRKWNRHVWDVSGQDRG